MRIANVSFRSFICVLALGCVPVSHALAQAVVATISVGKSPTGVGVNSRTNKIYVANSGDNTVSVIDGTTNTVTATITGVTSGQQVAVNSITNRTFVDEFETANIAALGSTLTAHQIRLGTGSGSTSSQGIAVNSQTNTVYVCSNGQIVVINGGTGAIVTSIPVPLCVFALAVDETRNQIYAGTIDKTIQVIDGTTNAVVNSYATDFKNSFATGLAMDSAKNRLGVAYTVINGPVEILDAPSGTLLGTVSGLNSPESAAFTPSGGRLVISEGGANSLRFVNTQTFNIVKTLGVGKMPLGLAINATTRMLYVANFQDNTVSVVSLQ
jgi:YVTN family beta-propeller protein